MEAFLIVFSVLVVGLVSCFLHHGRKKMTNSVYATIIRGTTSFKQLEVLKEKMTKEFSLVLEHRENIRKKIMKTWYNPIWLYRAVEIDILKEEYEEVFKMLNERQLKLNDN